MKPETTLKHLQILETAIKRFSHFGVAKTSLTEIADDLGVTKQNLSYYFPDKQGLVTAVAEEITSQYLGCLTAAIDSSSNVEHALFKLIDVKASFFEKYFMLLINQENLELIKENSYNTWRTYISSEECRLLTSVFKKGITNGELRELDSTHAANVLLDTLFAISRSIREQGAVPDHTAFHGVLARQRAIIEFFYQGIKSTGS